MNATKSFTCALLCAALVPTASSADHIDAFVIPPLALLVDPEAARERGASAESIAAEAETEQIELYPPGHPVKQPAAAAARAFEDAASSVLSPAEIWLSIGVLVFTFSCVWIFSDLSRRMKLPARLILQGYALTLVVGSAAFLLVAGYSDKQLTPVIGVLGTALGFVFGQGSVGRRSDSSRDDADRS